jgi:hypothetical protein
MESWLIMVTFWLEVQGAEFSGAELCVQGCTLHLAP